jgi:hypothetical protein
VIALQWSGAYAARAAADVLANTIWLIARINQFVMPNTSLAGRAA